MGGKGSGGTRVGAGRKPKGAVMHAIHGTKGAQAAVTAASTAPTAAEMRVTAPELPPSVRRIWDELAGQATAAGTLVPGTMADFVEMCRLRAHTDDLYAAFLKEGYTDFGLKLERAYRGSVQRLETKMRAFRLAPIGKELASTGQEKPKSALEKLQAKSQQLRAVK